MSREVNEVINFLKAKSIRIPLDNEWITSCVECFKEPGNISSRQLCELVYQQWLLADLSDIGVQVIPNNLLKNEKYVLEGKYAVQLNYVVNVAVSFHKQIQKIRRPETLKNLEIDSEATAGPQKLEQSPNRMLKIEITDGIITFIGFEDQFIASLKEPFVPGMKAILIGPIEFRKSIAFLKPNNFVPLGGEVESLHVPNATENILARALKLPENPDPFSVNINTNDSPVYSNCAVQKKPQEDFDDDEDAMMMLAEVIEKTGPAAAQTKSTSLQSSSRSATCNSLKTSSSSQILESFPSIKHSKNSLTDNSLTIPRNISKSAGHNVFSIHEASNIGFDDDFDQLAAETAASVEMNLSNTSSRSIDTVAAELNTYEVFDSASIKKDVQEITDIKRKLTESYGRTVHQKTSSSYHSLNFREDGMIVVDALNDKVSPLTALPLEPEDFLPDSTQNSGFEVPHIEQFPPRKRPATVTARGRVLKIKKPKIVGDKWVVSAQVEAKSIEMEVSFDSEVIDKIFRISAAEINAQRQILATDLVKKAEMNKALKEAHSRLSNLSCDMNFTFKDAISEPIITDVFVNR